MRLKRLILQNVRCYAALDISFEGELEEKIRSRSLFLGNNGTGKSTILRSIALLLSGSSALGEILGEPNKWIRNKTKSCSIKGVLLTAKDEERIISIELFRNDNLSKIISRNKESLELLDGALEHNERNYLTIGYGVHRKVSTQSFSNSEIYRSNRASNVATLFNTNSSLKSLESWIIDTDYIEGPSGIKAIKSALNKLLPNVEFYRINKKEKVVEFRTKDGVVEFGMLSDGFQIAANWLGDLLYRITETYQDYKKPLDAKFILLIDEIALHLHPSWQRMIIDSISDLFPNAQIITTTHSPFVAQQAKVGELYTIKRNSENEVIIYHYEDDPRKLLLHQIIMSDLFGVNTDESLFVENIKESVRQVNSVAQSAEQLAKEDALGGRPALKDIKGIDSYKDLPMNMKGNLNYRSSSNFEKKIFDKIGKKLK